MNLIYDEHEGQGVYVKNYGDVTPFEFREQISEFLMSGYEVRENKTDRNSIAILKKGNDLVLIAYYPTIKEMRVVTEPNSSYFSFKDTPCNEKTDALITQIDLEDFGLSYAIIYMADQQVSAVVRSKISKRKIAARDEASSETEVYAV